MTAAKIRVGIIGASPSRGWAKTAHLPALRALDEYEITAVAASREESAREVAAELGIGHALTDPRRLAELPDVDLVAVTVRVPAHDELVRAALDAGKHVYCEWPLARTTEEADGLARLAREVGVHHVIGLQARESPALTYARELIAGGYVGRVTSVTAYAALSAGADARTPAALAYTKDAANGAGPLEVMGGHTLDAVEHLVGAISEVSAVLSLQRPRHTVTETGETVHADTPDHVLVSGLLRDGGVVSANLHTGQVTNPRCQIEIAGTDGDLVLAGPVGGVQLTELTLSGGQGAGSAQEELAVPEGHRTAPDGLPVPAVNVAQVYLRLAGDLRTGGHATADFDEAVRVHALLDAIRESAATRSRVVVGR
jgi:predicted dehydrogenase